jgi:hypothetical protein
LHFPVLPQTLLVAAQELSRGAVLAGMFVQLPRLFARAQLWQPPVQAELQQIPVLSVARPFTQKPEEQSVPSAHTLPVGSLSPHLFVCVLQVMFVLQSVFAVQVVRQVAAVVLQA